jgi:hypothetical protein
MSHATHTTQEPAGRLPLALTHADLHQFTGDLERYRHPLSPQVIYTPGVRYVAEKGHAYWLIDAIASYFGSPVMREAMRIDPRIRDMQFWRLHVNGGKAVLVAEADAGEEPFIRQEIPYTDFPLDAIDIWAGFDGTHWTLYLPSEH